MLIGLLTGFLLLSLALTVYYTLVCLQEISEVEKKLESLERLAKKGKEN
jgi:hypothetical protein